MKKLVRSLRRPIGATPAEYMVMLILVALFIIAIIRVFGGTVSSKVFMATNAIDNLEAKEAAAKEKGGNAGGPNSKYDKDGNLRKQSKGNAGRNDGKGGSAGKDGKGGGQSGKDKDGNDKKGGKKGDGDEEGGVGEEDDGGGVLGIGGTRGGKDEKGGINPIVLLLALLMVGLLFYTMVGKKKG